MQVLNDEFIQEPSETGLSTGAPTCVTAFKIATT